MDTENLFERVITGKLIVGDPTAIRINEDAIQKMIEFDNLNMLSQNTYIPINVRRFCLIYLRRCKNKDTKEKLFHTIDLITNELRVAHFITFVSGKVVENLNINNRWFGLLKPMLVQSCDSYIYQPATFHKALINASYQIDQPMPPPQPVLVNFLIDLINSCMKLVLSSMPINEDTILKEEDINAFLDEYEDEFEFNNEGEDNMSEAASHISSSDSSEVSLGLNRLWNKSVTSVTDSDSDAAETLPSEVDDKSTEIFPPPPQTNVKVNIEPSPRLRRLAKVSISPLSETPPTFPTFISNYEESSPYARPVQSPLSPLPSKLKLYSELNEDEEFGSQSFPPLPRTNVREADIEPSPLLRRLAKISIPPLSETPQTFISSYQFDESPLYEHPVLRFPSPESNGEGSSQALPTPENLEPGPPLPPIAQAPKSPNATIETLIANNEEFTPPRLSQTERVSSDGHLESEKEEGQHSDEEKNSDRSNSAFSQSRAADIDGRVPASEVATSPPFLSFSAPDYQPIPSSKLNSEIPTPPTDLPDLPNE